MKIKIKHVVSVVAFVCIFAVLFVLVSYLLRPDNDMSKTAVAGFYAEKRNSLDMVVLGSSAAYRYIVPAQIYEQTGITSYVIGTPAQPFDTVPALLRESEKSQHPKLYIIELRSLIMNDIDIKNKTVNKALKTYYLRNVTDNFLYSPNRVQLINETVKDKDRMNWFFDLINYHTNWKTLNINSMSLMLYNKKNIYKGVRPYYTVQKQTEFDPAPYAGEKLALEKESQNTLINVLDLCKKLKANVLFVSTPYVESKQSIEEENYVSGIIKNSGFPYINYNYDYKQIGLDFSTDFYNNRHVNTLGAIKMTNVFTKYIVSHYHISHNHGKSTKADWENACTAWNSLRQTQEKALNNAIKK